MLDTARSLIVKELAIAEDITEAEVMEKVEEMFND
jgi:RNA polymerase-interacting CarD/CdnL/TRCF family regulator